jgi:signal transduction histidine kinase
MTSYSSVASTVHAGSIPREETAVMQRLLRVPLGAKLAGANLIIVVVTWITVYATHVTAANDWRLLGVVTLALAVGLVVNLTLVSVALKPIRDLEETAKRVWSGDLATRVPSSHVADADLAQVGGTLNYLLGALERDRERVRVLAKEIVRTGDRERSRVGRELHDSIAQSLAALRYQLVGIEQASGDPQLVTQLREVRESAGELLEQIRLLSHAVHPQILDDLGLVAALRHLVRTTSGSAPVTLSIGDGAESTLATIPNDVAVALYRVAQEAAANALRHSSPTAVRVNISVANNAVVLQVEDDGNGFDPIAVEQSGAAMGLFTMRERIALLGGTFDIQSTPTKGTIVCARIPLS